MAIKAMAAKLPRLVYRILRYGMKYADQGATVYELKYRELQVHQLKWKAAQLGYKVAPILAAQKRLSQFLRRIDGRWPRDVR